MKTNKNIRVVILIPVYNGFEKLLTTLESLKLEEPRFDVLIVDDGSQTPVSIMDENYSFNLSVIRQEVNSGIEVALNCGLEEIVGSDYEFVVRLDVGDLITKEKIKKQLRLLVEDDKVGIVGASVRCVDDEGVFLWNSHQPTSDKEIRKKQYYTCGIWHTTAMIRVSALKECGFYSLNYKACEDFELWRRIGRSWKLRNISDVVMDVELASDGISLKNRSIQLKSRIRVLLRYFDFTNPHSYLGLMANCLSIITPYNIIFKLKQKYYSKKNN